MAITTATGSSGAQVSLSGYVDLVRNYLNDWEYEDRLQTELTLIATTVDVLDGTNFGQGDVIQIESEYMYVDSVSTNALTVRRGWRNSTAAGQSVDATVRRGTS